VIFPWFDGPSFNSMTNMIGVRYEKDTEKTKRHYPEEFKQLAIVLAKEIGTTEAAQKEIKRLKKELELEKKSVAILKDAAAFFCQDHLK